MISFCEYYEEVEGDSVEHFGYPCKLPSYYECNHPRYHAYFEELGCDYCPLTYREDDYMEEDDE